MSYFSDLGLAEPILRALGAKGYSDPTPIQQQAIPALLEGRDLLGIAQTGTGKTAAFALPSLHRLASDPQPRNNAACRMLVLSPTRELAAQIADNMRGYAKYLDLSVQCVFGGLPVGKQARNLVRGTDILVATPGRLLDLIDQRALTLRHVEIFVLDEADQMMDLGFIKPLTRIAAMLPEQRQSLFFSATMPQAIAELGKRFIRNPVRVEVAPQATTAERVEQYSTYLNQAEKQALLTMSLRKGLGDKSIDRSLVFTRTKHGADRVVRHLCAAGINAAAIHGNKSQAQRTRALDGFRKGSVPVMVATDIAARGIDVTGVSHVFNFEIPNVAEQYVHRIGRTARAGADGVAISYVAPDERSYMRDIEKLTGVKLTPMPLPKDFVEQAAGLPKASNKPAGAERAASDPEDRHQRNRRTRGSRQDGPRTPRKTQGVRIHANGETRVQGGERRGPGGSPSERHANGDNRAQQGERRYRNNDDRPRDGERQARHGESRPRDGEARAYRGERRPHDGDRSERGNQRPARRADSDQASDRRDRPTDKAEPRRAQGQPRRHGQDSRAPSGDRRPDQRDRRPHGNGGRKPVRRNHTGAGANA